MSKSEKKSSNYRSLGDPETLRQFVSRLREGIYISTPDGDILDANKAFLDMVGVATVEDLKNLKAYQLMDPAKRSEEAALLKREGAFRNFEFELKRPDGRVLSIRDTGYACLDESSGKMVYHGILVDITPQKTLERQLQELSLRDPLTGCYNRRYLAMLEPKLNENSETHWSCIYIDLDNFKAYNDRHGHAAGDTALVALSRFLLRQLRGNDVVVRVGGDEFLAVLAGAEETHVSQIAQRLEGAAPSSATTPFSMGWASRRKGETLAKTIERADQRLISVKITGRAIEQKRRSDKAS